MLSNPFKKLPIRIERMMMYMQEFTFMIEYRPGKDNISDYLSRHAPSEDLTRTPCTICRKCDFEEEIVTSVCGSFKLVVPKAVLLEELKLETSRDEILRKVKNILEVNSWQQFKQDPKIITNTLQEKRRNVDIFGILMRCNIVRYFRVQKSSNINHNILQKRPIMYKIKNDTSYNY